MIYDTAFDIILKTPKNAFIKRVRRLVDSFSTDILFGISGGKMLTGKHLFAHGFYSMSGNKEAVKVTLRSL